jgi:queuine tRNA-ribosyltransferase
LNTGGIVFQTTVQDEQTLARCGVLDLPHGKVETPVFMPVGTNAAVKAIKHSELENIGFSLILGNTYHLYLRPGTDVISRFKGLHKFSGWDHNILTDSGGYQIFSLAPFRKVRDEGVSFRSHIDGSSHHLTPEKVVETQRIFQSDILMPLDVCTSPGITYREALNASDRTTEWAKRSKTAWLQSEGISGGKLFGIIQGNFFRDLREKSAGEIISLDLPGLAIGGLSVGESYETFLEMLHHTARLLPREKPHYLMGIGTPDYILAAVENGIDMFDCVFPTRIARNGTVFTSTGRIALKREAHTFSDLPIDPGCTCSVCRTYSRGYIRHLFKASEILGPMLATHHNLAYLRNFVEKIRDSIKNNTFGRFKSEFLASWKEGGAHE